MLCRREGKSSRNPTRNFSDSGTDWPSATRGVTRVRGSPVASRCLNQVSPVSDRSACLGVFGERVVDPFRVVRDPWDHDPEFRQPLVDQARSDGVGLGLRY